MRRLTYPTVSKLLARSYGLTIPELASRESLTPAYVGKLLRVLRQAGLVLSTRGQAGGYTLAKIPAEITIGDVLHALDGNLYSKEDCKRFTGTGSACVNARDCSIRALWSTLNDMVETVLSQSSLQDLICGECSFGDRLKQYVEILPN